MKNTILYLFIFSVLFNIFQYVNSTKILEGKEKELQSTNTAYLKIKDSVQKHWENDFALETNENAQEYFYAKGIDFQKVIEKVTNDINELNTNKNGNILVDYDKIDDKPFLINKIKVLNHRWLIAEYSNGKIWGEVLVKYFLSEDAPADFETIDTVLFTSTI